MIGYKRPRVLSEPTILFAITKIVFYVKQNGGYTLYVEIDTGIVCVKFPAASRRKDKVRKVGKSTPFIVVTLCINGNELNSASLIIII